MKTRYLALLLVMMPFTMLCRVKKKHSAPCPTADAPCSSTPCYEERVVVFDDSSQELLPKESDKSAENDLPGVLQCSPEQQEEIFRCLYKAYTDKYIASADMRSCNSEQSFPDESLEIADKNGPNLCLTATF